MKHEILHASLFLCNKEDINVHKTYISDTHNIHAHDFIELAYISSGEGTHMIDAERVQVSKGDIFLLNTGIKHHFIADKGKPLTIYNCIFNPATIDRSLDGCDDFLKVAYDYLFHTGYDQQHRAGCIQVVGTDTRQIEALLEEMYTESGSRQDGYLQVIRSSLIKLLIFVFRLYKSDTAWDNRKPVYKKIIVDNTIAYMRRHYAEDISCDFLAGRAYLSLSYFNKVFKEISGTSANKELQNIRMEAACKLLQNTTLSVEEIAKKTGYSDTKYFYTLFKKQHSTTPGEYRTRLKTPRLNYE